MESITESSTPSIPVQTSQFIALYAKHLPPSLQIQAEETVFMPPDTSGWSRLSNKQAGETNVFLLHDAELISLTGTASVLDVRPKDKQFPVHHEIITPLNHHMTCLLTEVAIHHALTAISGEWLTVSIPEIARKSATYFTDIVFVERSISDAVSERDTIAGIVLTDEVSAFASAHAIRAYLSDTISLIRRTFPNLQGLDVKYEHDIETDQEWLSIEVKTPGDVDQILQQYDHYVRNFIRLVPWPERSLIRLNYEID